MINPLASSGPSSMIPAGERQETDALPPDTGERPKVGIGRARLVRAPLWMRALRGNLPLVLRRSGFGRVVSNDLVRRADWGGGMCGRFELPDTPKAA